MAAEEVLYVDAKPINGHLTHAVRNQPANFTRTAPFILITYTRALCGVGRGGMRVSVDDMGQPRPYVGVDGCDACAVKVRRIMKQLAEREGD